MPRQRKLRKYNGCLGGTEHAVIAAYSGADAARLINDCGYRTNVSEFRKMFFPGCWGNDADAQLGEEPTERGLWVRGTNDYGKPYRRKEEKPD